MFVEILNESAENVKRTSELLPSANFLDCLRVVATYWITDEKLHVGAKYFMHPQNWCILVVVIVNCRFNEDIVNM